MKRRRLLIVEWEDITGSHKWHEEEDAEESKTLICTTVGWQMKSSRKHLTIASTRSEEGQCIDRTTMARSVIKSIRRLE